MPTIARRTIALAALAVAIIASAAIIAAACGESAPNPAPPAAQPAAAPSAAVTQQEQQPSVAAAPSAAQQEQQPSAAAAPSEAATQQEQQPSAAAAPSAAQQEQRDGSKSTGRFSAVSAGAAYTCGLRESGEIVCWGGNEQRQSDPLAGRFSAVNAGGEQTCALRESGEIACWGDNRNGQAGPLAGRFSAVSAGTKHTCGLRESGEIACWGENLVGQTDAPAGRDFIAVSAGGNHTCGLRESGAIVCWGYEPSGWNNYVPEGSFTAVSAGDGHTCAVRESGEIECWEHYGQTTAPAGGFSAVSTGGAHACGLRDTGAVACWGRVALTTPTGRFIAVSAGGNHACAIREGGTIACWGNNNEGQASPPAGRFIAVSAAGVSYRGNHTCAIREGGTIACWGENEDGQSDAPEGSFIAVSAGYAHTCAIRESGGIVCWGEIAIILPAAGAPPSWSMQLAAAQQQDEPGAPGEALKIGFLADYSGAIAEFGPAIEMGVRLAIKHLNDAGGVFGQDVQLVTGDTGLDVTRAVEEARRLVEVEGVHAVVGPLVSGITLPVAEFVTGPAGVPTISPTATSPQITQADDNGFLFRSIVSAAAQGPALAQLAAEEGYSNVSVLYVDNAYGQGIAESFLDAWGGESISVAYAEGQPTYLAELQNVAGTDVEVLIAIGYPAEAEVYVREALENGLFDTFLFVGGTKSQDLIDAIGQGYLNGMKGTAMATRDSESLRIFDAAYEAEYGEPPSILFVRQAYDAAVVIGLAAASAGSTDGARLRDHLHAVAAPDGMIVSAGAEGIATGLQALADGDAVNYDGAATTVDWNAAGDVTTGVIGVWQYAGGRIEEIAVIPVQAFD